ncbi:MAG: tRNA preQ1(34) S-adenosylmethionine ribosyltransferase-isomerase QueA [Candidatus Cloacimonetes bacterium]|nr:tRNA preQ1(34) S-adenosylmethionine ribosyltransferase-isomerase QueA [Candidatus Cloacimonadota bacterium]MCF7813473.1 tRNA preQ1(34) S-adenosylmethionine ribosyltransferase-isomerase QueA [Candidatus Cloacimonadota bacterium]MCF7869175.1 tRNA preQ1(34) S-adenosylmethionine ribosyltransferase-isomerase QueA [Candidatus Cloacimonadota bacterium]MCF7883391.1 tRNA preQ1(34) S-adenosylmethionine ribosyltransferase-isomerase QueA [Candidatus Cloacimonadota bacterium]
MKDLSKTSSYWYDLPPELVAQFPVETRSESRLLKLEKKTGKVSHHKFSEIIDFLVPGDVLVVNKTKVIPARLFGNKTTGANVEVFLLNQLEDDVWECLVKPGRRLQIGVKINFSENFSAEIVDHAEEGGRIIRFYWKGDFWQNLDKLGKTPLPPYIKRDPIEKDRETYQTVYAQKRGSVAAPTAGLHFTPELLEKIKTKNIEILEVVLRVGLGTFRPVKTDNIAEHKMHSEFCEISQNTAEKINKAKEAKRRIIAVGTTTTRTLESFAQNGKVKSGSHWTDIFIYPGKNLQIINGLITNFHMPESTLMMLVSAFAGYENIMNAYKIAVQERYRFFSYGDAMVIL